MPTFFTGSTTHFVRLGDGHSYDVSRPGKRQKTPAQFGQNGARTAGVITTTCPECVAWFRSPQGVVDFPEQIDRIPLTADEYTFRDGSMLATSVALQTAMDTLKAIQTAEAAEK